MTLVRWFAVRMQSSRTRARLIGSRADRADGGPVIHAARRTLPLRARPGMETKTGLPSPAVPLRSSDHAWQILAIMSDSIRYADKKGAVGMSAAGAVGGVLYDVVRNQAYAGIALYLVAGIDGILVIAAAIFAGLCMMPRLRHNDDPSSLVYFHHIARRHQDTSGSASYEALLKALSADDSLLTEDLSAQIWANAQVARQKYRMISLSLAALLLSIAALAATVAMALARTP